MDAHDAVMKIKSEARFRRSVQLSEILEQIPASERVSFYQELQGEIKAGYLVHEGGYIGPGKKYELDKRGK